MEEQTPFKLLEQYIKTYYSHQAEQGEVDYRAQGYLGFSAAGNYYLLNIAEVLEVVTDVGAITPLPFSKSWLLGLVSHRNEVYSVVDFNLFLDKNNKTSSRAIRNFILLQGVGQSYILKVDGVYGLKSYEVSDLDSEAWIDGRAYMEGKDWVRINLEHLVSDQVFIQNMQ